MDDDIGSGSVTLKDKLSCTTKLEQKKRRNGSRIGGIAHSDKADRAEEQALDMRDLSARHATAKRTTRGVTRRGAASRARSTRTSLAANDNVFIM